MFASIAAWALLLGYVATGSSIAAGFALYANVLLKSFTGHLASPSLLILVCILATATMAYRDVKLSARTMLWLEAVSVACILVVLLLVLWKNGLHLDWPQLRLQGSSISSVRLGLVLAIFSFVGFESATALGHEAREPLRTIPRAVLQCAVGAGVFFVGYLLFEVPSNLLLLKVGARRWIARIMITWGIISAGMMFVTTPTSFYIMRFLLGLAQRAASMVGLPPDPDADVISVRLDHLDLGHVDDV